MKRIIGILLILAVVVNGTNVKAEDRLVVVESFFGDVQLIQGGGEKSFLPEEGMFLEEGTAIITGKDSGMTIIVDDDKEVIVDEKSFVTLEELRTEADGEKTGIRLLAGKLWSNIKSKLGIGDAYEIRTPNSIMGARGTKFFVTMDQEEDTNQSRTQLTVVEGIVSATSNKPSQEGDDSTPPNVQAGQSFEIGSDLKDRLGKAKDINYEELDLFILETILEDVKKNPEAYEGPEGLIQRIEKAIPAAEEREAIEDAQDALDIPSNLAYDGSILETETPSSEESDTSSTPTPYITIGESIVSLVLGEVGQQLTLASYGTDVEWTSSNPSVATVDGDGFVSQVDIGTTTVTASFPDGTLGDRCTVYVTNTVVDVTGVALAPTSIELNVGESYSLIGTVEPNNASNQGLSWTSSNEDILTVEQDGTIHAVADGTAQITAKSNDGGFEAYCQVTILKEPVTDINIIEAAITLEEGNSAQLTLQLLPATATDKRVQWSVSDDTIIEVDDQGLVTGKAIGSATVTVKSEDDLTILATSEVTVIAQVYPLIDLILSPTTKTIEIGESFTISTAFNPDYASNKSILWESEDDTIATVDGSGKVTGVSDDVVNIYATSLDNNDTETVLVTVQEVPVSSVSILESTVNMVVDTYYILSASVSPERATNKDIEWHVPVAYDAYLSVNEATGEVFAKSTTDAALVFATASGSGVEDSIPVSVKVSADPITSISIDQGNFNLAYGTSNQLTVTIDPVNATNPTILFETDDPEIVSVDGAGIVTATGVGTARITAKAAEDNLITSFIDITVNPIEVTSITMTETLSIEEEKTFQLTPSILPANATDTSVTYQSTDTDVVTVVDGLITAVGPGTADVVATTTSNGHEAICSVTVTAKIIKVDGITLSDSVLSMSPGSVATLLATVNPDTASDQTVTWSSSSGVVSVSQSGELTANDLGSATITVKTNDGGKEASCVVNVVSAPIGITIINPANKISMTLDETITLEGVISPSGVENDTITWISSNGGVASVADGVVTPIGKGVATIYAYTHNGKGDTYVLYVVDEIDTSELSVIESYDENEDGKIDRIIFKTGKAVMAYNPYHQIVDQELGALVYEASKTNYKSDKIEVVLDNDQWYTGPLSDLLLPEQYFIYDDYSANKAFTYLVEDEAAPMVKEKNEGYDPDHNSINRLTVVFSESMVISGVDPKLMTYIDEHDIVKIKPEYLDEIIDNDFALAYVDGIEFISDREYTILFSGIALFSGETVTIRNKNEDIQGNKLDKTTYEFDTSSGDGFWKEK